MAIYIYIYCASILSLVQIGLFSFVSFLLSNIKRNVKRNARVMIGQNKFIIFP